MLEKLHVQVLLNTMADSELIELYLPDVAIVAMGEDNISIEDLDVLSCKVIRVEAAGDGYEKIIGGFRAGLSV